MDQNSPSLCSYARALFNGPLHTLILLLIGVDDFTLLLALKASKLFWDTDVIVINECFLEGKPITINYETTNMVTLRHPQNFMYLIFCFISFLNDKIELAYFIIALIFKVALMNLKSQFCSNIFWDYAENKQSRDNMLQVASCIFNIHLFLIDGHCISYQNSIHFWRWHQCLRVVLGWFQKRHW